MRLADPVDQATGLRRLFKPEPAFRALGVLGADGRGSDFLLPPYGLEIRPL